MLPDAKGLVSGVKEVFTLPSIYYQIDEAMNDPLSTASRIGRIISDDTGLAACLLRMVNSAYFGLPSKIDTISRAITVIGTRQLRDLALATSVVDLFDGIPDELVNMELFWKHSVACGVAARILATYCHETNVERYFVAGMLHDIGSLVIYSKVPKIARDVLLSCQEKEHLLYATEQEMLGFDHAEVGGLLLESWELPARLVDMVRYHHNPQQSTQYPLDVAIIHTADFISYGLELGASGERFVPPLDSPSWDRLGLSEGVISNVVTMVEQQYNQAVQNILTR